MLATLADEVPVGQEWLYEVKWTVQGARVRRGGRGNAHEQARERPDRALRRRGAHSSEARARRLRPRRRGLCARRGRPVELQRHAAGLRDRWSSTPSTCSRSTGSPCSISRSSSGVSACARSSIFGDDRPASRASMTAGRSTRRRRSRASRVFWPRRGARATSRAGARATGSRSEDPPGAGLRRRRLHEGQRASQQGLGSLVPAVTKASSPTWAMSARVSTRRSTVS